MLALLRNAFDGFAGRGAAAVTIPAMDGALRPNTTLEDSERLLEIDSPDNLVGAGDSVFFSSRSMVFDLDRANLRAKTICSFAATVSALAVARDGTLAVGLADGRIDFLGGPSNRGPITQLGGKPLTCPTALVFTEPDCLYLSIGSARYSPDEWQRSLMTRDATGSVWFINLSTGQSEQLAGGLAYPYGLLDDGHGLVVSESWGHRLIRFESSSKSKPQILLDNLPGYPSRHVRAAGNGSWLTIFAPRSQLIEYILRERRYRAKMMEEIGDPNLWVSPSLFSRRSFLEPMQGGSLKQMGILKPWSPTRSYGLVVRLDSDFLPLSSFHSRSDGRHHGIRSCLEVQGALLSSSGGGDAILRTML
jgi:hypothetical protein